jgi:hypothetical protein
MNIFSEKIKSIIYSILPIVLIVIFFSLFTGEIDIIINNAGIIQPFINVEKIDDSRFVLENA